MHSEFRSLLAIAHQQLNVADWRIIDEPSGNEDRCPDSPRYHAIVCHQHNALKKVTIGRDLVDLCRRQKTQHEILPQNTATVETLLSISGWQVLFQSGIDGNPLENLLQSTRTLPRALIAWSEIQNALRSTEIASGPGAREEEWQYWISEFTALPCWEPQERQKLAHLLTDQVGPNLFQNATTLSTRWSNGDFTTQNIMVPESGSPWLIDGEHAARTHFAFEDQSRLILFSPTLRAHPGLRAAFAPTPTSAQFTFFQLRQLWLEYKQNSPSYLTRTVPTRKQLILTNSAADLTEPIAGMPFRHEESESAQLFGGGAHEYTESRSERRTYVRGRPQWAAWNLENQTGTVRIDPSSSQRRILIRDLVSSDGQGHTLSLLDQLSPLGDCTIQRTADGAVVTPDSDDPQLSLSVPASSGWLIAEFEAEPNSKAFSQPNPVHS